MSAGLYVHYPFCSYLCNYCDYFKILHDKFAEQSFFDALKTETRLVAEEFRDTKISSIFIGGGTPSIANLSFLKDWLVVVKGSFSISERAEFTVECNPDSVSSEYLSALKELGVNRPNFGIQSFNPHSLKLLTRNHTPHQSHQAVYFVNALDFQSFGGDLLFGLPKQSSDRLSKDVAELIDLRPPHISFYELTVEEHTPLYADIAAGNVKMPDDDLVAAMFRSGCEKFTEAGYEHYEVSSFALPGHECRHNLNSWEGGEYIGLGPSAHSYIKTRIYANVESVSDYIKYLSKNETPRNKNESGLLHHADDAIRSGLRLKRGIDRDLFVKRFGIPLDERINQKEFDILIESEMLEDDGHKLRTSQRGFFQADAIARRLIK